MSKIVVGIVAGEASGDLLGSYLIESLKQLVPNVHFVGIGGPKMAAQGMEVLFPMEKLAVRGYVEVLRHYREIMGIRKSLRKYLLRNRPQVFIGIDAPDFNLDLELILRKKGIPTIHYVSPSIWAWRGERIKKIKKAVSHMLTLFPHEKPIYDEEGVRATYVGHPLADVFPLQPNRELAREKMQIPAHLKVFAFLPGSRQSEVRHLADTYIATAKLIVQQMENVLFLVPVVSRETKELFQQALDRAEAHELPLRLLHGHAHDAITASNVVLVASGTATLECALLKRPMVITYKMPALSYWIIQRKRYQPYVGLPNILLGRFVVPELLQHDATPENLSQALLNQMNDLLLQTDLADEFLGLHRVLKQNTAEKAAEAVLPYLNGAMK